MAETSIKTKLMKLSQEQYKTLVDEGQITVEGVTYEYSPEDTIYVTPDSIGDKSYKIVESLPVSNIDLDTYYLTKQGPTVLNWGSYCTNGLTYPKSLPSFNINDLTAIFYSDYDGCFYRINAGRYAGQWSFQKFSITNNKLCANFGDSYTTIYYYKYNPANDTTWTELGHYNPSESNKTIELCNVAENKKFKLVYFNYYNTSANYEDGNETFTFTSGDSSATAISGVFFNADGDYLDNDPNNIDTRLVQVYNMNVYDGSSWSVVGVVDLQEAFEYIQDEVDTITGVLAGKADAFTVGENLSLINGVLSAIITGALKFSNALPQSGTSGALYLIPNGLPSDVAELVNLAYSHFGSLENYPYLIYYDNYTVHRLELLQSNDVYYSGGALKGTVNSLVVNKNKTTSEITYDQFSSHNYDCLLINASNFDVKQGSTSGETYYEANIDSSISYASGASIATSFKGYTWNGSQFVLQSTTDLTTLLSDYAIKSEVNTALSTKANASTTYTKTEVDTALSGKQATLVSGTNIKTINSTSLLGSGNIEIGGGDVDTAMSDSSTNAVQNKVIKSYVDTEIDDNIGSAMWQILGGGS